MPAIRPDAPTQVPQYGSSEHKDELAKALMQHIMGQLNQPTPQAPMPPTPQPLNWAQAAAGAMNPQFVPYFQQQANAPGQAAYQQAQGMFESAMQNRRDALTAGTQLVGRDIAGQYALARGNPGRPQIRVVSGPNGSPALQEFIPDGQGGYEAGKILASGVDTIKWLQGQSGYTGVASHTGEQTGSTIVPPGGMPVPSGVGTSIAADVTSWQSLNDLGSAYKKIRELTSDQTAAGQYIRTKGVENFRAASALWPDYADYIATRRRSLNAYVKSVTGAQFSEKELQRYESQYPEPWDPPELADRKIKLLQEQAVNDARAKGKMYPGSKNAVPSGMSIDDEFDAWQKSGGQ